MKKAKRLRKEFIDEVVTREMLKTAYYMGVNDGKIGSDTNSERLERFNGWAKDKKNFPDYRGYAAACCMCLEEIKEGTGSAERG